jgi:hypothetical protein
MGQVIDEKTSKSNEQVLMDMGIGQQIKLGEWTVIKVPGGWVFSQVVAGAACATFVPQPKN